MTFLCLIGVNDGRVDLGVDQLTALITIFLFDQNFALVLKANDARTILLDTSEEVLGTTKTKKVNS